MGVWACRRQVSITSNSALTLSHSAFKIFRPASISFEPIASHPSKGNPMARAKQKGRKFKHRDLNTPIVAPSPPLDARYTADVAKEQAAQIFAERLRKIGLLFEEYGIQNNSPTNFLELCFALATDVVRGFQVTNAPRGRPKKEGPFAHPPFLLALVERMKQEGRARTDAEACEMLAEMEDPSLKSARNKTRRRQRARTIGNQIAAARADARRKLQAH
jgi:hypothetical protein